jgi:hypothetical protein
MFEVFSGIETLLRTKRTHALYRIDISTNITDIKVLGMIYNTA